MLRGRWRRPMLGLVCGMSAGLCIDSLIEGIRDVDDT